MDLDLNDPYDWEMVMYTRLRQMGYNPGVPRPAPGSQLHPTSSFVTPKTLVESLKFCVRAIHFAVMHEFNPIVDKRRAAAEIAIHFVQVALIKQLETAEMHVCPPELLIRTADILHQMYSYAAVRLGLSPSVVRPPGPQDKNIERVMSELRLAMAEIGECFTLYEQQEIIGERPSDEMFVIDL